MGLGKARFPPPKPPFRLWVRAPSGTRRELLLVRGDDRTGAPRWHAFGPPGLPVPPNGEVEYDVDPGDHDVVIETQRTPLGRVYAPVSPMWHTVN